MTRRLRFNGTGSGNGGCPSVHEDLDTGEVIVHGPPLTNPEDIAQLQHLSEGEQVIVVPRAVLEDWAPKSATQRQATIISVDEFGRLFETFKHTAWRLETRRAYGSDAETETYAQFVRGEPVEWDLDDEWCSNMRRQTGAGKTVGRVRILDNPPTTGQLYLMDNAQRNAATGEDMRNLWRADAERLRLPNEDFWIFDSRLVALLIFDSDDNLLHVELITEPAEVVRYSQVRDAAMHHAVPSDRFAEQLRTAK
ncbi:hypothetical protein SLUN_17300 [Streptomyces lunaelactis]|uniref:DUF6879 domain-containing protein n=1 Tax=Streptomyces lunaelactis TaxID=1535768 RepID=A0A2R4T3G7_9ACTN|nr:DUF6879 family protein [Streptomyces lunaelactis]AVZ73672.1 hypothetical protein SLUN_17300 [Streptomyces lunaelactis]NUK84449.1 hypothetical protein [Streptomyces lunaelactis]NUL03160.1 hypothetical protein [Streptomyces lunaelactis]